MNEQTILIGGFILGIGMILINVIGTLYWYNRKRTIKRIKEV